MTPDLPMNRVESPCRKVKVSNQNSSNPSNHAMKHHKLYHTGMMPLPGLEPLRQLKADFPPQNN